MSLRRLLTCTRNHHRTSLSLLLLQFQCRNLSHVPNSLPSLSSCSSSSPTLPTLPSSDFLREFRRSFAKGRKSKNDDDSGATQVVEDIGPVVKSTASLQMEAALDALLRELNKLRTGRASTGMLDHIIVETGGVKMNLNRIALVTIIDSKTLSITPYDSETIKEIEKAIVSSPLGLNPKSDGQRLIAAVPPLTKEHIQAMCKVVSKASEDVKQSVRRARQKALDSIKKAGYPKDSAKRFEKEVSSQDQVDELTKKFVKSAEDMCKAKEKEISSG